MSQLGNVQITDCKFTISYMFGANSLTLMPVRTRVATINSRDIKEYARY